MIFYGLKQDSTWKVNSGKSIYYIQHNLEKLFVQSRPPRFRQKPNRLKALCLFPVWGGHYGPDDHKQLYSLYKVMARATKILDFVPFYVWMVTGKLFLDFFKKIDSCDFKGSPLKKSWKFQKMYFLFKILFSFNESIFYICLAFIWDI